VFTFDETTHISEVLESIAQISPLTSCVLQKNADRLITLSAYPWTAEVSGSLEDDVEALCHCFDTDILALPKVTSGM
jgi:hypothetical protein